MTSNNVNPRHAGAIAVGRPKSRLFASLVAALTLAASPVMSEEPETVHVESLIAQSQGMERRFRHQSLFFQDAELETYLTDVLKKLASPEEYGKYNLRIRILKSRAINAFAAPDGAIYISTGLLSRVINETQIAALLAHELGHLVKNHAERNLLTRKENARAAARERLERSRSGSRSPRPSRRAPAGTDAERRPPSARAEYARIFSAGIGIPDGAFSAPAHDYLQEFEREADSVGIARLAAAGYLSGAGDDGNDGAHTGGQRRDSGIETAYFNVKLWSVVLYETSFKHAAGQFSLVEEQLERLLSVDECDPAALVMRGDMERLMSPRSTSSFEWYEKALACDPGNHGALLALGLANHAVGNSDRAREFLEMYSEAAGNGIDIKVVREVIGRCEQ